MFSEPVVGEKFFGREEVLELLNKRVLALKDGYRQNVALTGQSLAGKSSILLHFLATIKDESFIPVYIEVVKEPFRSFANRFIATLLYNSLAKMGEEPNIDMDSLLEKASKILPKTSSAIKHVNSSIDRDEFDEAYTSLLGLTSIIKEETRIPCIVILDEFDNLEYIGVKNTFLSFGKVIMVQKNTMYIVSSSRNQAIKKILSEKLSLLFGNFEIVKISGFDTKRASQFIEIKLAGFETEDEIKKFLITFTDGNPFYLNHLVNRIEEIAIARMSNHIDAEVLEQAILDLVYNSNGVIHQYLLNFILDLLDTKSREEYIAVLGAIASGRNRQPDISRHLKFKNAEVAKALVRLMELGIISKSGVFHRIDDVVLEFWLRFVYQKRKALVVDGPAARMKLFSQELRSYIEDFSGKSEGGAIPMIAELFNHFSNELIQMDGKMMKLPRFTKVEIKSFANATPFIAASFRGKSGIVQPFEHHVSENDIIDYVRNVKAMDCPVSHKIIVPLKGIDENAKLLAKELKISIWEISVINMLLTFYGKPRIAIL